MLHILGSCLTVYGCRFTSAFGTDRYQAEAGRRVGVQEGEAWRTALLAAAQHGASQVVLLLCKQLVIMSFLARACLEGSILAKRGAVHSLTALRLRPHCPCHIMSHLIE